MTRLLHETDLYFRGDLVYLYALLRRLAGHELGDLRRYCYIRNGIMPRRHVVTVPNCLPLVEATHRSLEHTVLLYMSIEILTAHQGLHVSTFREAIVHT